MGSIEVTINILHMFVTHIFTVYCSMCSAVTISSSGKLSKRSNKSPHSTTRSGRRSKIGKM